MNGSRGLGAAVFRFKLRDKLESFLAPAAAQRSALSPVPTPCVSHKHAVYAYISVACVVAAFQWVVVHEFTDLTVDHYAEGLSVLQDVTGGELSWHKLLYRLYAIMLVIVLGAVAVSVTAAIQFAVARLSKKKGEVDVFHFVALALVFAMLEAGITGCLIAEMHLLSDMAVHFIDFDLASLNFFQTVKRRHIMGANLKPALQQLIRVGAAVAIVSFFTLTLFAARIYQQQKRLQSYIKHILLGSAVFVTIMLLVTNFPGTILSVGVSSFQEQLPFNFFHFRSQPVYGANKVSFAYPPTGGAYPILSEDGPYPILKHKRNIFYIPHESLREVEYSQEYGPESVDFFEKYGSITSEHHVSAGHVSEVSHFALKYGLHGYLYNQYMYERVPSFFFDTLRRNGYLSVCLYATRVWSFPNDNLFNNCDEIYIDDYWTEEIEAPLKAFLAARAKDGVPFLFYLSPYRRHVKEKTLVDYGLQQDKLRKILFDEIEKYNFMSNSVVLLTGDHGDMNGEHKEQGHGQQESNWWNEKMLVPFQLVLPEGDMHKYHRKLGLTSHVDIVPTLIEYLQPAEKLPVHYYSNGMNVLVPVDQKDPTQERYVVQTARYFPLREKTNAFAHLRLGKFWYRVTGVDSHGHFIVVPMFEGNWNDESTCPLNQLRTLFPAALERAWARATPKSGTFDTADINYQAHPDIVPGEAEAPANCKVDYWAAVLVDYNIKFNTFYASDPPLL